MRWKRGQRYKYPRHDCKHFEGLRGNLTTVLLLNDTLYRRVLVPQLSLKFFSLLVAKIGIGSILALNEKENSD
jgi:hypothetical protein